MCYNTVLLSIIWAGGQPSIGQCILCLCLVKNSLLNKEVKNSRWSDEPFSLFLLFWWEKTESFGRRHGSWPKMQAKARNEKDFWRWRKAAWNAFHALISRAFRETQIFFWFGSEYLEITITGFRIWIPYTWPFAGLESGELISSVENLSCPNEISIWNFIFVNLPPTWKLIPS